MLVIYNSCICLHMASIDIHHITLTIQTADVRPVPLREGPRTEVMLINLNWFPAWRFSGSQILMGSPCSPPLSFQFIACLMEKTNSVKPLMTHLKHQSAQSITSCQYFRFVDVEWIGKTSSRRKLYKCHYKHLPSRIDQASWGMVLPPLGSSPHTRGASSSSIYIVSRIPDTSKQEPTTITIQIIQPQAAMHPVQINMRV